MKTEYSLMVHGGAGNIRRIDSFAPALLEALDEGARMLRLGKAAGEVALKCITILEDSPRLNAGTGSSLNEDGNIEMEAAIMHGKDLSIGAVGSIDRIKNPILVAELVRKDPDLVKLVGAGAIKYAFEHGIEEIDNNQLITERQRRKYAKWSDKGAPTIAGDTEDKMGTVGTVVIDKYGDLVAATSTGGLLGRKAGRIGDTSTIGSGTYANQYAAISCTGRGEDFVALNIASRIAYHVEEGMTAKESAREAMLKLDEIPTGKGGVIVVDRLGNIGSAKTESATGLAHGAVTSEMDAQISILPDEVS